MEGSTLKFNNFGMIYEVTIISEINEESEGG